MEEQKSKRNGISQKSSNRLVAIPPVSESAFQITFNPQKKETSLRPQTETKMEERKSLVTSEKLDFLVIDTGAFINGVEVDRYAKELFTIPEVLNEVRDKFARDFLNRFPWEIKMKEPSQEAISHGIVWKSEDEWKIME